MKNLKKIIWGTFVVLMGFCFVITSCSAKKAKSETTPNEAAKPAPETATPKVEDWLSVSSIKETFVDSGIFEHFGFAISDFALQDSNIMNGVTYHGTSMTAENSFKPDGLLWGLKADPTNEFVSSKGTRILVPEGLNFFSVDKYLEKAKALGLKMRGHVLVWHSQTPDVFFKENFDSKKSLVGIDEMEARQEWYIKTVLEHIKDWEAKNNGGEHIIYAWDVVNEAADDGANGDNFLRTGSNWYAIYKSDKFIVDAFRYANKYAPEDVLLAYNDYNEYQGNKHEAILRIINDIQAAKNDKLPTRIDVVGMQSHMNTSTPSATELEKAIASFVATGLDIHITELDITGKWLYGNECEKPNEDAQVALYKDAFKLYKKYAKTDSTNGVTGVTVWGVDDTTSWRSKATPLPFKKIGNKYYAKPAFYGIIEAAK